LPICGLGPIYHSICSESTNVSGQKVIPVVE
jgi:hypothetical protein